MQRGEVGVSALALRLMPSDDPGDAERPPGASTSAHDPSESEDLAYKVEIWSEDGETIEQVVAVTSSPSIGFAAYYAATREFPNTVITLRHRSTVMSKWGGKPH